MTDAAAFRGQPLLVFAGVLCAWLGLRVALWQPLVDPGLRDAGKRAEGWVHRVVRAVPVAGAADLPVPRSTRRQRAPSDLSERGPARLALAFVARVPRDAAPASLAPAPPIDAGTQEGIREVPLPFAVGHNLLLAAGLSRIELPSSLAAYVRAAHALTAGVPAAAPFVVALPRPAPGPAGPQVSADAWLMVRQDTTSSVVSARPSYGRSQAGAVVRYRLAPANSHGLQAYLRASSSLEGARENDLAAGLAARPLARLPLRIAAEARVSETDAGTELRPAAMAVTEFAPLDMGHGLRAEAYVQGGYVGGRFATAFVDGQARIERRLAHRRDSELAAGAGAWGGAQKGAARLDVGPTASVAFRLGAGRGRIAADYRFRVAGDAEPRSGAALTLSAGF